MMQRRLMGWLAIGLLCGALGACGESTAARPDMNGSPGENNDPANNDPTNNGNNDPANNDNNDPANNGNNDPANNGNNDPANNDPANNTPGMASVSAHYGCAAAGHATGAGYQVWSCLSPAQVSAGPAQGGGYVWQPGASTVVLGE